MFLDKLKTLFRKNDDKNRIKTEYASPRNEYYATVADRYGTVQMLLFVLLSLFLVVALLINSEWISYENFYYFVYDFGDYITSADGDIESIVYDTGNFSDFGIFSGKLAVAGANGLKLYTSSGRTAFEDTDPIAKPSLEISESFMLSYDSGGSEYRIYNLFTVINSQNTDYPIYGASIADNGAYALITGDGTHTSCVKVYNRRFDEIQSIGRASYVVGVSMTPSGDRVAVVSYSQSGGSFTTHLYMTRSNSTEPYAELKIENCFPLYCEYTEKGFLNLICKDRILTYNTYGTLVEEIAFEPEETLKEVDINRFGAAVMLRADGKNRLVLIDAGGRSVYNSKTDLEASAISLYGEYAFLLGPTEVTRIDAGGGRVSLPKEIEEDAVMLVRSETEILLCMPSRVRFLEF